MDVTSPMTAEELQDIAKVCRGASVLIEKLMVVIISQTAQLKDLQRQIDRATRVLEGRG